MRTACAAFAVSLACSVSTSALAAPATPEEAARLTGVFESILGKEPGVVSVAPRDESYDVKLDFTPYLKKYADAAFKGTISPYPMTLTPRGGGKWLVAQDAPFAMSGEMSDLLRINLKIGNVKATSLFDEAVGTFIQSSAVITDMSFDQFVSVPDPTGAGPAQSSRVAYALKNTTYESKLTPVSGGAVDGTIRTVSTGFTETFNLPPSSPGGMLMDFTITADSVTQDAAYKGMKAKAIADIVRWFIAHPSEAQIDMGRADMVKVVEAALPLFETITSKAQMSTISVTTPMGPAAIAKAGVDVDMNGVVKDGKLREAFSAEGIALPPGLVPPFAAGLAPEKFSLDFTISDFDLAASVKLFLDHLAKTKDAPTPELEAQMMQALMPSGTVKITLAPGEIVSKSASLGYEGAMTAGPAAIPSGAALLTAKGFDALIAALNAAPPEMGMAQANVGLLAAKGFAKSESDGSISWKIESTPEGGVLVNGLDVSKMGK
jgi:hypothetical protein